MSTAKLFKYRLLSHLPGAPGRKYANKYNVRGAQWQFMQAVRNSAGKVCIDLGANMGEYTRMLASTAKKVYAFEPDPWTCETLRTNLKDLDNVEIVEAAASTSDGTVQLFRHPDFDKDPTFNSQSSSLIATKSNISHDNAQEVRQVDLLKFMRDLDTEISVLKIDIEGAEVDLLEALLDDTELLKRIHHVFAETHETRIPGHEPRVAELRRRAYNIKKPNINLYWE
ncbi:MAG: FkbM family methyltransferase [Pseudomonadota bacterium]